MADFTEESSHFVASVLECSTFNHQGFGPYSHDPLFTITPNAFDSHQRAKKLDKMFQIIDIEISVNLMWKQLNHLGYADLVTFMVDIYGRKLGETMLMILPFFFLWRGMFILGSLTQGKHQLLQAF